MKKSQQLLFKLASKFQHKYGQSQVLQKIIQDASAYGENSPNGIMDFMTQLKKDKAHLIIDVEISHGLFGNINVVVSDPVLDPSEVKPNYIKLPQQIKNYLDKYIKDMPQIPAGSNILSYSGQEE